MPIPKALRSGVAAVGLTLTALGLAYYWSAPSRSGGERDLPADPLGGAGSGSARFDTTRVDLGEVTLGESLTPVGYDFRFRNTGTVPIRVRNIRTSCQCTAAALDPAVVPPGGDGRIRVTIDSLRGRTGRQRYEVSAELEEGETVHRVSLVVTFTGLLQFSAPDRVVVEAVAGREYRQPLVLTDYRQRHLTITRAEVDHDDLSLRLVSPPRSYDPGWQYKYELVVSLTAKLGTRTAVCVFHTDDPERPRVLVTVEVHVADHIRFLPPDPVLSAAGDGSPSTARIVVDDRDGRPVQIGSVHTPVEGVSCQFTSGPSTRAIITVAAVAGTMLPERFPIRVCLTLPNEEAREVIVCWRR